MVPTWGSAAIGVFAAVGIGWAVMQKMPSQVSTSIQSNPIQVAQTTSQPVIAEMNEQLTSEQRNMLLEQTQSNLAVNELYKLWGYRASVRDNLCLSEPQSTMRCERKMAT